jgi:hypothetical protein
MAHELETRDVGQLSAPAEAIDIKGGVGGYVCPTLPVSRQRLSSCELGQ